MKHTERGTTYRSVRHRGGASIEAEHAAPERAVESSLSRAKGAIASENLPVDEQPAVKIVSVLGVLLPRDNSIH